MVERRADVRRYMVQRVRAFMLATCRGPLVILNDRDDLEWRVVFGAGLCVIPRTEEEFWRTRDAYAKWRLLGTSGLSRPRASDPSSQTSLRRSRQVGMPRLQGLDKTPRRSQETDPAERQDSTQLASCQSSPAGATIRDGESGTQPATAEPLEVHPSMPTAVEKVAAALAARQAGAAPTKTKAEPVEDEVADDIDDESEVEALEAAPPKKLSVAERNRLAREAREAAKAAKMTAVDPDSPLDEDDADDEGIDDEELTEPPKKVTKATPAKGKKPASPKQIAAREAFAARSKERAAASAKAKTPVQTEAQVKAKQSADRKAEREAAAEAVAPSRSKTPKPTVVQKPLKGAALATHKRKLAAEEAAAKKAAAKKPASKLSQRDPAPSGAKAKSTGKAGDTKSKVLALVAKGKTRRQIADTLDISYASVYFHTKDEDMGEEGARGRVFVDDPLYKGKGKAPQVSRSEAMRRCFDKLDMTIGDIARKYDVRYQIAYTAIRSLLPQQDEDE